MRLSRMTKDYAQALLDTGFHICENIGDNNYECACYNDNTVSELLVAVDKASVQFCKENWAGEGIKWNLKSVKQAHMDAIGYAIYQAVNS